VGVAGGAAGAVAAVAAAEAVPDAAHRGGHGRRALIALGALGQQRDLGRPGRRVVAGLAAVEARVAGVTPHDLGALGGPLGVARTPRLGQEQRTRLLLGGGLGARGGVALVFFLVVVEAQRTLLLRLFGVFLVRVGVVPLHQPEVDGRLLHESGHARPSLFELTVNRSPVSAV